MPFELSYVTAPQNWSYKDPNPFTADDSYGSEWSAFCLLEEDSDQFFTGKSGSGPFSARFGKRVPGLITRLADFLRYESAYQRKVILSFPTGVAVEALVAQALSCTPDTNVVRSEDPPILIHATTQEAWKRIRADGELKAASQLAKKPNRSIGSGSVGQVEEYLKNEPPEYNDYIMFGVMDSYVPEMVVASNRAGYFILDENAIFEPGVRLYFDNHRVIQDGFATRDGLHVNKVHQRLPLYPYLLAAICVEEFDPPGQGKPWTIRNFVDRANEVFQREFMKNG